MRGVKKLIGIGDFYMIFEIFSWHYKEVESEKVRWSYFAKILLH